MVGANYDRQARKHFPPTLFGWGAHYRVYFQHPFVGFPSFGGFGVEGFVLACGWAAVCGGLVVCGWVVGELYSGCFCVFIFCVISVFEFFCVVLVFVGVRWMPWCQELMKDVAVCDIPRGVDERALIRGFPNGVT